MSDQSQDAKQLIRLSKVMAERGICSRREADDLIARGAVYVNGLRVSELGTKVPPDCKIELSESAKEELASLVTVILNKPIGFVSAQPEKDYQPAIQLLTAENFDGNADQIDIEPVRLNGLAVAGRLDIDSQGLLIFTQDGTIAKQLIGENTNVEKEYLVRVQGRTTQEDLKLLNFGLELDGAKLKPAKVEWINQDQLRFVLKEGKKRQVRRMCEAVGLKVLALKRVRVGEVRLSSLPEGKWRYLNKGESFIKSSNRYVGTSRSDRALSSKKKAPNR